MAHIRIYHSVSCDALGEDVTEKQTIDYLERFEKRAHAEFGGGDDKITVISDIEPRIIQYQDTDVTITPIPEDYGEKKQEILQAVEDLVIATYEGWQ